MDGIKRGRFGSTWQTIKEDGVVVWYFCWSKPRNSPWGNRAGAVNWGEVHIHGWQEDDIGRGAADKDALSAAVT